MSRVTVTQRGRASALDGMLDTVVVTRPNPATSTTDPDTGVVTPGFTAIYTGPCKVQQSAPASGSTDVGEAAVFINPLQLHVPVTATTALIAPDDLATITVAVMDPSLAGKTFKMRGQAHKSFGTARRIPMIEVTG